MLGQTYIILTVATVATAANRRQYAGFAAWSVLTSSVIYYPYDHS
jgi:hypothetical protein